MQYEAADVAFPEKYYTLNFMITVNLNEIWISIFQSSDLGANSVSRECLLRKCKKEIQRIEGRPSDLYLRN